jgi:hypothetical protein
MAEERSVTKDNSHVTFQSRFWGKAHSRRACFITATLCAVFGLGLQFLLVNFHYGGNWTGLFCTGSKFQAPPELADERPYIFPNSTGYDGQMYHYVAHDPLMRTNIWRYVDLPQVRYQRIFLPATAFLLAAGRKAWIDPSYIGANLVCLFLGAWWLSRYLELLGLPARLALLFVFAPATLISLERLTVDLAFTALCVGFALYMQLSQNAKAYGVLALACLTRDTGFLLGIGTCVALSMRRRFWTAVKLATAMLPTAAWYWYVSVRLPSLLNAGLRQLVPFKGIFETLRHPIRYPFSQVVNAGLHWLDGLAIFGFLLAALLTLWLICRNGLGPMETAMALWSLLGICLPRSFWEDCYSGARVFTPLLIYLILCAAPAARRRSAAPLLMVVPRIVLQFSAPLVLAIGSRWL